MLAAVDRPLLRACAAANSGVFSVGNEKWTTPEPRIAPFGSRYGRTLHHLPVFLQDIGCELGDAVAPGDRREMFQQQRANPLLLKCVGDRQRHLGPAGLSRSSSAP